MWVPVVVRQPCELLYPYTYLLYACHFYAALKKICGPYKHQICGGNMQKWLSYIVHAVSLAGVSCCRRWPAPTALALTMLLAGSWAEILLLLPMFMSTKRYAHFPILTNWILVQTETQNIKIIKIAVKSANSCREKYATCALCWNMRKCGNMRSLRWLYIGVQLTCLTDADLYNGCKAVVVCMNAV